MSPEAIHTALQRRGINARQVVVPPRPSYEIEAERVTWLDVTDMSDAFLLARLARVENDRDEITAQLKTDLALGMPRGHAWRTAISVARKHRKAEIDAAKAECIRRGLTLGKALR